MKISERELFLNSQEFKIATEFAKDDVFLERSHEEFVRESLEKYKVRQKEIEVIPEASARQEKLAHYALLVYAMAAEGTELSQAAYVDVMKYEPSIDRITQECELLKEKISNRLLKLDSAFLKGGVDEETLLKGYGSGLLFQENLDTFLEYGDKVSQDLRL